MNHRSKANEGDDGDISGLCHTGAGISAVQPLPRRQDTARRGSCIRDARPGAANRDGLLITRLVGFSRQKVALNEMVSLYTNAGEQVKLQVAQQQLRDIDAEVNELRNAAQASD